MGMLQMGLLPATLIIMLLPTQIAAQLSVCRNAPETSDLGFVVSRFNVKTGGASKVTKAPIRLPAFTDIISTKPFLVGFFASHQAMQENIDVTLFPYDAGTDSGVNYGSPNTATNPPQSISRFTTGHPLASDVQETLVRTFTFIRQ